LFIFGSKELHIIKGQHDSRLFLNFLFICKSLKKLYPSESSLFVVMMQLMELKQVTAQQDGDLIPPKKLPTETDTNCGRSILEFFNESSLSRVAFMLQCVYSNL